MLPRTAARDAVLPGAHEHSTVINVCSYLGVLLQATRNESALVAEELCCALLLYREKIDATVLT